MRCYFCRHFSSTAPVFLKVRGFRQKFLTQRTNPAYYLLATVVAASRVYVRLHHASDVIGGALLGIAFGRVARRLAP